MSSKNISSINTPIRFHLPNGDIKFFKTSSEAQDWFDENYSDGYSAVEYTPTEEDSENPIELRELIVTAKSPTKSKKNSSQKKNTQTKDKSVWDRIGQFINDEIFLNENNVRVKNYQRAEARNPNFSTDWDMASNIAEGLNIMSGGVLNRLSPTQNIGLIIDVAKGKNFMNSWFGNSGIVSDNFAQQHPYLSFGINALGDFGIYYMPKAIKPTLQVVDRLGTRNLMNQETPNTLNRLIGTGTSGYEDALSSGVVRGNIKMGPNAKSMGKQIKVLKAAGVPDETIRNYASNNISEQEFYQLKRIFDSHYGGATKQPGKINLKRTSPFEDYETYQDYLDGQIAPKRMFMYSENPNNPQWSHSWDGHNMATFAEPGENLSNNAGIFPGDFGVQITNSPLYRQSATEFGHFSQHPTTRYPMPIENPDVNFFVRKDGWLTGTKYMSKVPKSRVLTDQVTRRTPSRYYTQNYN